MEEGLRGECCPLEPCCLDGATVCVCVCVCVRGACCTSYISLYRCIYSANKCLQNTHVHTQSPFSCPHTVTQSHPHTLTHSPLILLLLRVSDTATVSSLSSIKSPLTSVPLFWCLCDDGCGLADGESDIL